MSFAVTLTRSAPASAAAIWSVLRDLTDAMQAGRTPALAAGHASPTGSEPEPRRASFAPYVLVESAYLFHVTLRRRGTLTVFEFIVTPRWAALGPFLRRHYEQELEQLADHVLNGLELEFDALAWAR
jgi:hypothetical protein